jgi:hypothetical protein
MTPEKPSAAAREAFDRIAECAGPGILLEDEATVWNLFNRYDTLAAEKEAVAKADAMTICDFASLKNAEVRAATIEECKQAANDAILDQMKGEPTRVRMAMGEARLRAQDAMNSLAALAAPEPQGAAEAAAVTTQCAACEGTGRIRIEVTRYVTRDMATDAGEPAMEGQPIPDCDVHICVQCGGTGLAEAAPAQVSDAEAEAALETLRDVILLFTQRDGRSEMEYVHRSHMEAWNTLRAALRRAQPQQVDAEKARPSCPKCGWPRGVLWEKGAIAEAEGYGEEKP